MFIPPSSGSYFRPSFVVEKVTPKSIVYSCPPENLVRSAYQRSNYDAGALSNSRLSKDGKLSSHTTPRQVQINEALWQDLNVSTFAPEDPYQPSRPILLLKSKNHVNTVFFQYAP